MKKKLALLLAGTMAVSTMLAGCGSGASGDAPASSETAPADDGRSREGVSSQEISEWNREGSLEI